jgi:hypothetical protein
MDMPDKGEAMIQFLETHGIKYRPTYMGWQSISCPNQNGHVHGDKNPSARVNLTFGGFACMGCGLRGDVFNLIMAINGCDFKTALASVDAPLAKQNNGFVI